MRKEGVTPRNDWFLKQYEASGTDTFHKPAMIYEKWTAMTQAERSAICPASPNKITKATVEQGIKRARKKRGT